VVVDVIVVVVTLKGFGADLAVSGYAEEAAGLVAVVVVVVVAPNGLGAVFAVGG